MNQLEQSAMMTGRFSSVKIRTADFTVKTVSQVSVELDDGCASAI